MVEIRSTSDPGGLWVQPVNVSLKKSRKTTNRMFVPGGYILSVIVNPILRTSEKTEIGFQKSAKKR